MRIFRILGTAVAVFAGAACGRLHASFELSDAGSLRSVTKGKDTMVLSDALGGFFATDVTSGKPVVFSNGALRRLPDRTVFEASDSGGIGVHAEFAERGDAIAVDGWLENRNGDDRAVILDYRVGLSAPDAVFSNTLNASEDVKLGGSTGETEGNAFPVASIEAGGKALAMAIPPDAPCLFGMAGSRRGLAVRFYLGVSPLTRSFPNRAPFHFILYRSEPGWGFRSALDAYYGFYPECYDPRMKKAGLWLFQVKGIVPENIDQYAFNVLEIQNKDVEKDLARDKAHRVRDLVYTIVGQREIKYLDALPKSYAEAMQDLDAWTPADAAKHPPTKENAAAGNDRWLKEEIQSSACQDFSGKYAIEIRDTPWGRKSVTFKVNPSPYLFADDAKRRTVGRDALDLIGDWIAKYPQIGGVLMDSFGANWPAVLDYRRDHFPYVRYPLTFDADGRLAIYNDIAHYAFAKALKDQLEPAGRALFANGIYAYKTVAREHYRAKDLHHRIKVGRFFDAALLDGATSEVGARADTERCQDVRAFMGKKYYSLINYDWADADTVEEFFNRSLCYDIFASNTKYYPPGERYVEGGNEGVSYVDNPEGYFRDKDLLKWFVPKARMLYEAGWEPVTHAKATGGPAIRVERYGGGNSVYFTVFNDSSDRTACVLQVDLEALGFTEGAPDYQELARSATLNMTDPDKVGWTLEPHRTYIVNMTKPWLVGQASPPAGKAGS